MADIVPPIRTKHVVYGGNDLVWKILPSLKYLLPLILGLSLLNALTANSLGRTRDSVVFLLILSFFAVLVVALTFLNSRSPKYHGYFQIDDNGISCHPDDKDSYRYDWANLRLVHAKKHCFMLKTNRNSIIWCRREHFDSSEHFEEALKIVRTETRR